MKKQFLIIGSLVAMLAVILGAFGAHALKEVLTEKELHAYEIGIRYQFYHAFALLVVGILQQIFSNKWLSRAGYCFLIGILLFSGSLYLLACDASWGMSMAWAGPLTPIGGVFFILGWGSLIMGSRQS